MAYASECPAECFHIKAKALAEAGYEMPLRRNQLPTTGYAAAVLIAAVALIPLFSDFSWGRLGMAALLLPAALVVAAVTRRKRDEAARFDERVRGTGSSEGPDIRHCGGCSNVLERRSNGSITQATHRDGYKKWAEKTMHARFAPPKASDKKKDSG
ncbi:hypothetical protein [Streptomyces himalayensis]|uniref:Uncharacterized protein n=1 Tax=Streptomyces himalayensis subsp. himalayensis TaxID=2756131 RepID=A0A7W0IAM8_9ACTN|nr:hypothetical protein [Streptomyces himalayensis]MBA2948321.1 hypothetical protein [Streptomyces himalayensis subsp. himalayensis]